MRNFFRILLLTLALMMVALVSALTAMRMAIHGREVTVPKVIGLSPADAERISSDSGLQVVVEREFYSADIPEGRIMTQVPPPGTKVRRGWSVRVARSLGPQRVSMPDVSGQSERAAEVNIRRRGLALGPVAQISFPEDSSNPFPNVPEDRVVAQSPPANASGVSAPKISLLVSRGSEPSSYVMPNLVGQGLGSASVALQDAGMHVDKVSVVSATIQESPPAAPSQPNSASIIVTQSPGPGQKIVAGAAVNLEVR